MGGKAALILVMGFGLIFGYLATRINQLESVAIDNTSRYLEVTNSHNLAVAGANVALAKLYQDTTLWSRTSDTVLAEQSFTTGIFTGGSFTAVYDYVNPSTSHVISYSRLQAYARTYHDTVAVEFTRIGQWDILGLMIGFRGNDDTWISRDTMWGRVHFNGRVAVKGSPVYNDKVTVSKGFSPGVGVGTNRAIFMNGYETGVNTVPLPSLSDTADTFPNADTVLIGNNISLRLVDPTGTSVNNDGYVEIRRNGLKSHGGAPNALYFYNLRPRRVLLIRGKASIRGRVDGALTIAATEELYIDSSIVYTVDPQVTPTSDDILGLVAINDVVVDNNPTLATTFNVQAIITSLEGTISAVYPSNFIGVLRNYGAIVGRDRTNIAQYSASGNYMRRGFYRRFRWDPRLGPPANMRPPSYPKPDNVPSKLQIANWWENVRIPQ